MTHRETYNADTVVCSFSFMYSAVTRIPKQFDIECISGGNSHVVALSGKVGRDFTQEYLSSTASWPITLDDM
jgi:hypothetical protein